MCTLFKISFRAILLLCLIFPEGFAQSGQGPSSFLGIKDEPKGEHVVDSGTSEHYHRINSNLWSLKGMTSHAADIPDHDSDLFEHPDLFNIALIMFLLFMGILSIISGAAGLIVVLNSVGLPNSESVRKPLRGIKYMDMYNPANMYDVGTSHPGCHRILSKEINDRVIENARGIRATSCRE